CRGPFLCSGSVLYAPAGFASPSEQVSAAHRPIAAPGNSSATQTVRSRDPLAQISTASIWGFTRPRRRPLDTMPHCRHDRYCGGLCLDASTGRRTKPEFAICQPDWIAAAACHRGGDAYSGAGIGNDWGDDVLTGDLRSKVDAVWN